VPRKKKSDAISQAVSGSFGSERVEIDEHLMAGFVETFLQEDFDNPKPSPEFHRELWRLFTSLAPKIVIAAPRGHAKSTAGTFSFGLACALFGTDDFILIVSATESLAAAHLANMARVIEENEDLRTEFGISILKNNETELVCRTSLGNREFCIVGKGAEQKVRGILWRNKRPSLILVDDLEEDEAVMSKERREKLRNWFKNALLPCGSDRLRVRFVGTVLHLDSLLERLMADESWVSRRFRAHASYDDFDDILWPEQFPEERLRAIRREYDDNPSGYSQEYLSHPVAEADAYFKRADFGAMQDDDYRVPKTYYAAIEFALGANDKADNTAIVVGGLDPDNMLHIVDVVAKRMDPVEATNLMFDLQKIYNIDCWVVEDENIAKAIGPFLNLEMMRRNEFMTLLRIRPHKDKLRRATAIKARMRAHGVKFDWNAEWFPAFQGEMMAFPRGKTDDRVDALAWLGIMMDKFSPSMTREELDEAAWEEEMEESRQGMDGRSSVTGY
jgi:predicted phage terminase large subunit-like protein